MTYVLEFPTKISIGARINAKRLQFNENMFTPEILFYIL